MQRRTFMKLVGGGIVVAAGGAAILSQAQIFGVPPSAIAAWRTAGEDPELRRALLSYALLAPNPHNLQPWIADLSVPDEIGLRLDPARQLPATDPYGRQILIGAGAFLELLRLAAAERGYRAEIRLFPEGEPGPTPNGETFARVQLVADPTVARDPLFAQVLVRHTDRRPYDLAQPPSEAEMAALAAAAGPALRFDWVGPQAPEKLAQVRKLMRQAWKIELTTEPAIMESFRVLRIGSAEIDAHRDGIAIVDPLLVLLAKTGLFDRTEFPAPDSQATVSQIEEFDAATAATPAYLWLVSQGNSRPQQIEAGRAYVRVQLAATAAGLAMHPNSQALQEYPEMTEPYQAVHRLLQAPAPTYTVQMLARVGRLPAGAEAETPAPRRGLDALIG